MEEYNTFITSQRDFFNTGATLPIPFRIEQLKKLKLLIETHEEDIASALNKDLNKPPVEAILSEVVLIIEEINFTIRKLKKWSQRTTVRSPFPLLWPGRSEIYYEPYGCVLIIGPWNYPFMLLMSPLIGAISAGNCTILKPSEISTHTQALILQLIKNYFPPEYIAAVKADKTEMTQLLQQQFDYIFFTGSAAVGKIIMEAAAKHLTPVTLELGGKSPCIIDQTADFDFAARRIMWAKTTNAGQVCIAPDFVYVHENCKDLLVKKLQKGVTQFYHSSRENSQKYGRIINQDHFARLSKFLQKGNILFGGETNQSELTISPTLIDHVSWDDPIMQEEIFGPILPILTYKNIDEVITTLKLRPKPLALYLFTKNKETEKKILTQLSFGGGCINDCMMQIVNPHLPFGGVGQSGMNQYHGKYSFETFSHRKSIYKKRILIDFKLEYPPYTYKKLKWLRKLAHLSFKWT